MGPGLSLISVPLGVLLMLFAAFLVCTSYAAAYVTLFIDDSGRRADAYRVLKLVLRVGTAGGTVVGILIRLYENGQLW